MSTLPFIVGVHGHARTGKDTIAAHLVAKHGYVRKSFADPMRDALYRLNPVVGADTKGRLWRLAEVVDDIGWDEAKAVFDGEIRRLLQVFGTEIGREWDEDFWVDRGLTGIAAPAKPGWPESLEWAAQPDRGYVFSDVRFENEVRAIQEFAPYSLLIKVGRPGYGPINSHKSDRGLPDAMFDVVIDNDGTLDDLHTKADEAVENWSKGWL